MNKIIPVLLAGGVGARLWPLSAVSNPKQFQLINENLSLFQQSVKRALGSPLCASPWIVGNQQHRVIIADQLQKIGCMHAQIMLEPIGKNTAPAIASAALAIAKTDPDAQILVLPSDHYIEVENEVWSDVIGRASALAGQGHLVAFGIEPTHAETGYGYLESGDALALGYTVKSFTEKPDAATAERYIRQGGYVWNSGMFLFPVSLILDELKQWAADTFEGCVTALENANREGNMLQLNVDAYQALTAISIDYAVMEKTRKAAMIPAEIIWSDMGSYRALWEHHEKDEHQNVMVGDGQHLDATGNYTHAQIPTYLLGVHGLVVVQTERALLVACKDRSGEIGRFTQPVSQQSGVRTDKPWGHYELVHVTPHTVVKQLYIKPGARLSLQKHHHRSEHWVVISGCARVTKGDEILVIKEGESVFVPADTMHRLENSGQDPLCIMEVQTGSYLGEDDIIRFEDDYGRIAS